jgi:hypothetical protein
LSISPFKISTGSSYNPRYEGCSTASEQDEEQRANWQNQRAGKRTREWWVVKGNSVGVERLFHFFQNSSEFFGASKKHRIT